MDAGRVSGRASQDVPSSYSLDSGNTHISGTSPKSTENIACHSGFILATFLG